MENEFAIDRDVLRLWEPKQFMVVVGNSSRLEDEVELDACARIGVPVLRRPSGGAAIVTGPGCLMYSLVLSYSNRPQLKSIDEAHRFVLETIAAALRPLVPSIRRAGISDLAMGDYKFSGNSLRCKRGHLDVSRNFVAPIPTASDRRAVKDAAARTGVSPAPPAWRLRCEFAARRDGAAPIAQEQLQSR